MRIVLRTVWQFRRLLLAVFAFGSIMLPCDAQVFEPGAALTELWNEGEFTEGVAAGPDGRIFFSDIPSAAETAGRILVYDKATGKTAVFSSDSRKSNGLTFDAAGQLLACCGANNGGQSLMSFTASGTPEVVIGSYRGRPFNAPNDLVVHPRRIRLFLRSTLCGCRTTDSAKDARVLLGSVKAAAASGNRCCVKAERDRGFSGW